MHTKVLIALLFALSSTAGAQNEPPDREWVDRERQSMKRPVAGHIKRTTQAVVYAPGMFEPRFPLEQLLHGEGGEVKVWLRLNDKRKLVEIAIAQSSGSNILDVVAEKTVRQWTFSLYPKKYAAGEYTVPIEFNAITGEAPTSYDGVQLIPLDVNQLRTINEAKQYLGKTCNTVLWEKDENTVVYKEFSKSGLNVWSFFEPEGRFGPSVVRRTISNKLGYLYVTTSYICEAGQESCKQLREYLDTGFSSSTYKMPGVFVVPKKLKKCN